MISRLVVYLHCADAREARKAVASRASFARNMRQGMVGASRASGVRWATWSFFHPGDVAHWPTCLGLTSGGPTSPAWASTTLCIIAFRTACRLDVEGMHCKHRLSDS